jgi:hypothetical protein
VTFQLVGEGLFVLAGLLAVVGMGVLLANSSSAAAWLLVAVTVLTQSIIPRVELQVTLAAITVYALDLVAGLMFAIGVVRLFTKPNHRSLVLPLAVLSALFATHVALGVAELGVESAVNGSRSWLYFLGPLVYASQARPHWTRKSFLPLIAGAGALAAYALVQIARHGLYGANELIEVGGELIDARPVSAEGALLIFECALIAASARFVRSTPWLLAVLTMGAAVLLLQHRTVWIVMGLTASVAYVKWARVAILANEKAALAAASAVFLVAPFVVTGVATSSAFEESVRSATGERSTFAWRTESWATLVEEHHSTRDLLVGLPAGTSLARVSSDNRIATESPHSLYVDALLSLGVLGPLMIVWSWILIVRRRRNAAAVLEISAVVVVLIVASSALFGVANMLAPLQGLLLGMLLQAAFHAGPRSDAEVPPPVRDLWARAEP